MNSETSYDLIDGETNETIGRATAEQIEASFATDAGWILVNADGDLVADGSWDAQQPGIRKAYVIEVWPRGALNA